MLKKEIPKILILVAFIILISLPRFGHCTPDSVYYLNIVKYFEGSLLQSELAYPFANRIIVPLLVYLFHAANTVFVFALINLLFTISAYILILEIFLFIKQSCLNYSELLIYLLIIVFPTFQYSSIIMSDAAALFFETLLVLLIIKEKTPWFVFFLFLAILSRETIALFGLIWGLVNIYNRGLGIINAFKSILVAVLPVIALLMFRNYFKVGVDYSPTINGFNSVIFNLQQNITNLNALTTFSLTFLPVAIFFILVAKIGFSQFKDTFLRKDFYLFLIYALFQITIFLFALTSATLSGRFIWHLYPVLIPCFLISSHYRDRVSNKLN